MLEQAAQEVYTGVSLSRIVEPAVVGIIAAGVTYLATRGKTKSETEKNETDTLNTLRLIISGLTDEIDEALEKIKVLRKAVGEVEAEKDKAILDCKDSHTQYELTILRLHRTYRDERMSTIERLAAVVKVMSELINEALVEKLPQLIRMKLVLLLEQLFNLKDHLEKKHEEHHIHTSTTPETE